MIIIIIKINKTMYNKAWMKKTITFRFNISIFTSFRRSPPPLSSKVLGRESNHWLLDIKESLFIKRDRPSLNKNIYSQELFLF